MEDLLESNNRSFILNELFHREDRTSLHNNKLAAASSNDGFECFHSIFLAYFLRWTYFIHNERLSLEELRWVNYFDIVIIFEEANDFACFRFE